MSSGSSEQFEERYIKRTPIGSGSFGEVYRAYDRVVGRDVAIKMPLPTLQRDDNDRIFHNEARRLSALNHHNIVRINNLGDYEGAPYIEMEYVEGQTLQKLLKEKYKLSLHETWEIIHPVSEALIHAHDKKIVHCDLKPANILISNSGEVKVTDFGLARAMNASLPGVTGATPETRGTPLYTAPELRNNSFAEPTFASDQYSLAAIAFEMLTGRAAFEERRTPAQIVPAIPQVISRVVMRGLSPDPEKRFGSIEEFYRNFAAGVLRVNERKTMSVESAVLWTIVALILGFAAYYFEPVDDWIDRIANVLSVIGGLIVIGLWVGNTWGKNKAIDATTNEGRSKNHMPWYRWPVIFLLVIAGTQFLAQIAINGVVTIQVGSPPTPILSTPTSTPTPTDTPTPTATLSPIQVTVGPDQYLSAPAGVIPLNGNGEAHDTVEILWEDTPIKSTRIAEDGTWSTQVTFNEAGNYVLQVKELAYNNILRKTHSILLTVTQPSVAPTPTATLSNMVSTENDAVGVLPPTDTPIPPSPSPSPTPTPTTTATSIATATSAPTPDLVGAINAFETLEKGTLRFPEQTTIEGLRNAANGEALVWLLSIAAELQSKGEYQVLDISESSTRYQAPQGPYQTVERRQSRLITTHAADALVEEVRTVEKFWTTIIYRLELVEGTWTVTGRTENREGVP